MDTMNIAVPEAMKAFAHERSQQGGYSSVSEYIRHLIRADQKAAAREAIEAAIIQGLESGEPIAVTREYWEEKRRELQREFGGKAES